jgi:hypothetical protein
MPKLSRKKAEEMREDAVQYHKDAVEKFQEKLTGLMVTTAFYRGNQHGRAGLRAWNPLPPTHSEASETINYIRPFVRSAVSDMLRNIPNPEVVSAHSDPTAMAKARMATLLANSFIRNKVVKFDTLYSGVLASQIHGASWFKISWDRFSGPSSKKPKMAPDRDNPQLLMAEEDVFGDPVVEKVFAGEIRVEHVNIGECLPDPTATTEEDLRYVVQLKTYPVTKLDEMFPDGDYFKDEIQWERNSRSNLGAEEALSVSDPYDGGSYTTTYNINDQAELAFIYEKPCMKYPNGRQIILHKNTLLHADRLPDFIFPFVLLKGQNVVESSLYSDGVVKDLIGPQRSINRAASKQREMLDRVVNPWLLEPRGAELKMDELSDMPGSIVTYNYGFQPKYIDHPPIDPSTFKYQDSMVSVMKDISTYSDVSRGDVPQNVSSGRALAYLAEFERGVHAPDVQIFKDVVTRIMGLCLKLAASRYEDGRLVQMLGPNNQIMVAVFRKEDFDFEHELIIEAYSGAPNSRAMRYGEALEAMQSGGLSDSPDAERFRRIVGWDYQGRSTSDADEEHKSVAQAENAQFKVDPYGETRVAMEDDHDTHIDEHNRFRISHEFRNLPEQLRAMFDAHVAEHENYRAQQLQTFSQEQNMLLNQTQGADGGAPPPKEPGIESPRDGGASLFEVPETEGMEQMASGPQMQPSGYQQ